MAGKITSVQSLAEDKIYSFYKFCLLTQSAKVRNLDKEKSLYVFLKVAPVFSNVLKELQDNLSFLLPAWECLPLVLCY